MARGEGLQVHESQRELTLGGCETARRRRKGGAQGEKGPSADTQGSSTTIQLQRGWTSPSRKRPRALNIAPDVPPKIFYIYNVSILVGILCFHSYNAGREGSGGGGRDT